MTDQIPHSRPWINSEDLKAVEESLRSNLIAHGHLVRVFEESVTRQLGSRGGIACTSGTAALSLALKTLGVSHGDEVILPTYVCWNVLAAVTANGATPRLCDVDESGVPTAQTIRPVLSKKTRAIVAVHIFGHPCDISGLSQIGLPVIEDACQALGLELDGQPAGSLGTLGILSFHATKCLTTGEGGMLVSNQTDLLERARLITDSAQHNNAAGFRSMSNMQAALGLSQLERYHGFLERRRTLFHKYHDFATRLIEARPGYQSGTNFLFRYTLRSQSGFEGARQAMLLKGIQVKRGVDELLHRRLGMADHNFPTATKLFEQNISLPFYPSLSDEDINRVILAMQEVFSVA